MIDHYRRMIDDPVRIAAFKRGIEATVRPGDVVVDLGCAFGNYAVLACRAGAARVYAVEVGPIVVAARRVAEANGCADKIRFLRGRSTILDVPERADVVIFEDYPTTLISPTAAHVNRDAVERWLVPGGCLLPGRARLWTAPVECEEAHREIDRFAADSDHVAGVDIGPTRHFAFCETASVQLAEADLLSAPELVAEIDLQPMSEPGVSFETRVAARRSGVIHGLALWFEMELSGGWLNSGPLAPPIAWKQVLFPLEHPPTIEEGEEIGLELDAGPFGDEMVWRWRLVVGGCASEASSFESMSLDAERLARWDSATVPQRDHELELDLAILNLVDGRRSLGEIASDVAARLSGRLECADLAQRRVLEVLQRSSSRGHGPGPQSGDSQPQGSGAKTP